VTRAVLDTNLWVSASLSPQGIPARVVAAFLAGRFTVVTSEPMLDELLDVLGRPRIAARHGWSPDETVEFVAGVRSRAERVAVHGELRLCRDPKDDVVVETVVVARADALVTGDQDFIGSPDVVTALASVRTRILTPAEFLAVLETATE
jgi:putative PIN family toxin of toxin-antitoxin system